jgi:hypothetical protein
VLKKPMRVWGGSILNRWKELGPADTCRLVVKANSKAEAFRLINVVRAPTTYRKSDFDHFFGETGNSLDLALCDYEGLTVWVRNDDVCLRVYDERRGGKLR